MNKFLATLLAGAFALTLGSSVLAADAAKPVEPAKTEATTPAPADDSTDMVDLCYINLFSMRELVPIAKKMGFPDLSKASFEQMANLDKVTESEKLLISKYDSESKLCFDLDMNAQPKNLHPKIKSALYENESKKTSSLIDLYNQKISYGEYIKIRKESNARLVNENDVANREIEDQNQKALAYQEAHRHKSLSDAFGNISNSIRNSMPPRAVNCNPNGFGGVKCQ